MTSHFEFPELCRLAAVIRSNVWVGNGRLITLLSERVYTYGSAGIERAFTAEFLSAMLGCEDQLREATINLNTLQVLVDSLLWRDNEWLVTWIFNRYVELNLPESERVDFGSVEFWNCVVGENYFGAGAGRPITDFYEIGEEGRINVRRFRSEAITFIINFRNIDHIDSNILRNILNDILSRQLVNCDAEDRIGVELNHSSLNRRVLVSFTDRSTISADRILSVVERIQQSNQSFQFDQYMIMKLVIVKNLKGAGPASKRSNTRIVNWNQWFKKHCGHGGCFIQIKNDDNLCFARAVVVAKSRLDKHPQSATIQRGEHHRSTLQKRLAKQLMLDSGLGAWTKPCGIDQIEKVQAFLEPEYQLKIYDKETFNELIYKGPESTKIIHLYLHDEHFDVITRVPAFFGRSYYCESCNKSYSNKEDHRCNRDGCPACDSEKRCQLEQWVHCKQCNRYFPSQSCFNNHKTSPPSTSTAAKKQKLMTNCDKLKRCNTCSQMIDNRHSKRHICDQIFCRTCNCKVDRVDHQCYIKTIADDPKTDKRKAVFIFFDFETRQDEEMDPNQYGSVFKHIPNFCVAYRLCDICRNNDLGQCSNCGGANRHVFSGDTCLDDFGTWLFSEENRGATAIAHNARGFDGQFLLEYLHRQKTVKPKVITRGLEILMMEAANVRIIDTLNFLPMPLAKFPKTFSISELKKGYFPHMFNTKANWSYEGPLPEMEFYKPDSMKEDDRTAFMSWYEKEKSSGKMFNFRRELEEYCESDVNILAKSALKFRDIFIAETNVDPFLTSLTIASACNHVFRKNFLKDNTIGIIPHGGYRKSENQSIVALKWLKWMSEQQNIRIRHKLNGGEIKIGRYKVDGLDESTKTVYEFNGCYYHGCDQCIKKDRFEPSLDRGKTPDEAFQNTIQRLKYLESCGYTVVEEWECKLKEELKKNPEMDKYFKSLQIVEPLGPREAFFGGRTNAIKLYHICEDSERIDYVDVCSLYPWVCKTGIFPLGHPEIITENFKSIENYLGIVKCKVLPPRKLYHPVLPYRFDGKLLFPLCRTCAENQIDYCEHTDDERMLDAAWVSLELQKAIELGYKIVKIHEIWNYTEWTVYDPKTRLGGLFAEYINKFLRLKQQADGWPSWVKTEEDKIKYVVEYEEREGIKLDPSQIEKNEGLRSLAKLMLNSFWGKFGQRNNMSQTVYYTDPDQFLELIFDKTKNVPSVSFFGESMVCATYQVEDDFLEALTNTNPVIASFVTAQARLKLYTYLEKLQERVLYMDTDSIIYLTKPADQYRVPTGSYLGDMTDELRSYGDGAYIQEFVAGGPKNYGYRVFDGDGKFLAETNKVRGIRLNFNNKKSVSFSVLKNMVFAYCMSGNQIVKNILDQRISRNRDRDVYTETVTKAYRVVYTKRSLFPDFYTLPLGY